MAWPRPTAASRLSWSTWPTSACRSSTNRTIRGQNDHTKAWSASVAAADAYVFVLPEYNFNPPPSFVNAVDFLFFEWNHKPASFVTYGGASGGLRSAQTAKLMLTAVKVMPIPEQVAIPMVGQHLTPDAGLAATDAHNNAAKATLDELVRWSSALKVMRVQA